MKKILSLVLAIMMLVSAIPAAFAIEPPDYTPVPCVHCNGDMGGSLGLPASCGHGTCPHCGRCQECQDYSIGTQVVYNATGSESYTITVPAKLVPGQGGSVVLAGTWADNRVVTVTADENVTLVNSILESDTKTLKVTFDGISETGDNTQALSFTEDVSVADISNALFGTWSGKFNYNVSVADYAPVNLISFTIDGTQYQAIEGMTWEQWVESEYNTDGYLFAEVRDLVFNSTSTHLLNASKDSYVLLGSYPVLEGKGKEISSNAYILRTLEESALKLVES